MERALLATLGSLILLGQACTVGGGGPPAPEQGAPFEPVDPHVYVPKVKSLLTGLAATDAEVNAVIESPNAMRGLIDQWMAEPSFKVRMLDFFRNAFQQNQVDLETLQETIGVRFLTHPNLSAVIARNIMDSFPLTAWQLIAEGRPFTETITTHRYMLTSGLMALMSYVDDVHVSDKRAMMSRLAARNPLPKYTIDIAANPAVADTLNPASPSYMVWPIRDFIGGQPPACATTGVTQTPQSANDSAFYGRFFDFMMGRSYFNPCGGQPKAYIFASQYTDADWNDWRMVTLNQAPPDTSSATPSFYELIKLRNAADLTLHVPRVGFFGTLAFATNWATNAANDARVTANQALIVALGATANGDGASGDFPLNPTDNEHASNPACISCHAQLDPLKQYFRQSYTLYYSDQTDSAKIAEPAGFSLGGVTATGHGVGDLAKTMAEHPRFALAWTQKLHFWATSTEALEEDPEMARIAKAFQDSNFDFKTLVRELFSSPLITLGRRTQTTGEKGVRLSIARRDQFCASLSTRLGLSDVCGLLSTKLTPSQTTVSERAIVMPVDTYFRGFALPSLPTQPDLFYRQSAESICSLVADQIIDAKTGTSKYSSQNAEAALDDFVATTMNLPHSDARAAQAREILAANFAASVEAKATPTDALKATFTLACLSPSSVLVGL